jgi:ABC-type polysaccharide/polyol phosphate export permease
LQVGHRRLQVRRLGEQKLVTFGSLGKFARGLGVDAAQAAQAGAQVAYFLTPILYRRSMLDDQGLGVIADLNPANTFIELIRAPLVDGVVPGPGLYLYGVVARARRPGSAPA